MRLNPKDIDPEPKALTDITSKLDSEGHERYRQRCGYFWAAEFDTQKRIGAPGRDSRFILGRYEDWRLHCAEDTLEEQTEASEAKKAEQTTVAGKNSAKAEADTAKGRDAFIQHSVESVREFMTNIYFDLEKNGMKHSTPLSDAFGSSAWHAMKKVETQVGSAFNQCSKEVQESLATNAIQGKLKQDCHLETHNLKDFTVSFSSNGDKEFVDRLQSFQADKASHSNKNLELVTLPASLTSAVLHNISQSFETTPSSG